jgi:uncharacterized RDD family membrane protein YckC
MTELATATREIRPPAELDRRFYAFALDRLIAWSICGASAYLAYRLLIEPGDVLVGVVVIIAVVLIVVAVFAVVIGLRGTSPGMATAGIRVVGEQTGRPIGAAPALLRQLILGLATLPTFGLGAATLAWTAVMDAGGRRRGWHDHVAHSVVVDVRPEPIEAPEIDTGPRHVVNLTAMRLVPAAQRAPVAAPARSPSPPSSRTPASPRQQLGYPLVPEAPAQSRPPVEGRTVVTGDSGAPAGWRVTFDSGESFLVEGLALVGRRPEPRRAEPVRHLVPLRSADMSLSKTHAQFDVAPDGVLVVMDRGSTNGSILIREGLARELSGGRPATLVDGDRVRFGDREMTVVREG